jgi:PAT family beta-lactamase induction signal transducer AmpG
MPTKQHDYQIIALFCLMGFVSGLPYALVTSTFHAWLSVSDVSIQYVGWFGLVAIPFALKPLWATMVDWLRTRCRWPLERVYLLVTSLLAAILLLVSYSYGATAQTTVVCMTLGCFLCATADISIDAMRICYVTSHLQGLVTSWFVIFYRVAFVLSGGLALVFAQHTGWSHLYFYMGLLYCLTSYIGYFSIVCSRNLLQKQAPVQAKESMVHDVWHWFTNSRREILTVVCFLLLFKFHGIFLTSLLQVFLLRETGMSLAFIGLMQKSFGMIATFLGGLLGGYLSKYLTVAHGVRLTIVLQLIAAAIFMSMASGALIPTPWLVAAAVYMESFCLGISTTFVTVMITRRCDLTLAATQYALFTAMIDWQRALISPLSAAVQTNLGWSGYFFVSTVMIPFVWWAVSRRRAPLSFTDPVTITEVSTTS